MPHNCNHHDSIIVDSRVTTNGSQKRRRECVHCKYRWTTYEVDVSHFEPLMKSDKRQKQQERMLQKQKELKSENDRLTRYAFKLRNENKDLLEIINQLSRDKKNHDNRKRYY